ncbi:MAG: methyltransferase [Methanosarcinales archaeon]
MQNKNKNSKEADPSVIMEMNTAFWISRTLQVANELEIFTKLSGKCLTLEDAAKAIEIPPRPAEMLLNACVALGLLEKENGCYKNSNLSEKYLVKDKPEYFGYMIAHGVQLSESWSKLGEVVKNNKPIEHSAPFEDEETARMFTLAMHSGSTPTAKALVDFIPLPHTPIKLLDVGGGSGVISIKLAEKYPNIEAVVFDTPNVCKVAQEFINQSPASNRIKTYAGDYTKELPKGFDVVILSNILHGKGVQNCISLLKKVYESLNPSGLVIILDFLLDDDKCGPVFPALFALNMLIATPDGGTYSGTEIKQWLEDLGFNNIKKEPLIGNTSMVLGVKGKNDRNKNLF